MASSAQQRVTSGWGKGESESLFSVQLLIDLELEIAVVVGSDVGSKDLIDHRRQVMERAHRLKSGCMRTTENAACGGQDQSVFDISERNAAIEESRRQNVTVRGEKILERLDQLAGDCVS